MPLTNLCCHTCGEEMIGDGYSVVLHCPYADTSNADVPDGTPVHCNSDEETEYE